MMYRVRQILDWFRQRLCRHDWEKSRFRALNHNAVPYRCRKCGQWRFEE